MNTFDKVIDRIRTERAAQDVKWGEQNHAPQTWIEILGEEFGETCKASLEHRHGGRPIIEYMREMIQTAAVAIAALETMRRQIDDPKVYLAGPMMACNFSEVQGWRNLATARLNIKTVDPARRDFSGRTNINCMKEIVIPDKKDIDACRFVLANCWQPSWGTAMEIMYAWDRNKYVIAIVPENSGDEKEQISAWIIAHSVKVYRSLEEGIDYINSFYEGRKKDD